MQRADKVRASAIVLGMKHTRAGDRWAVQLQIIGGAVETIYPTLDEAAKAGLKDGQPLEVDVAYTPSGQGESSREKDGKTFTDRFVTYRAKVFLAEVEEASRPKARV